MILLNSFFFFLFFGCLARLSLWRRGKKIGRNFNILWFSFSDRKEWKQTWWSLGEIYVFWNSSFSVWHIKKSKGKSEREIMFTLYFLFFTLPIPISSESVRPNSGWDLGLWESWLLFSLLSPSINYQCHSISICL